MPTHIPLPYRLLLLYFEPLAALYGAYLAHFQPASFLNIMTPQAYQPPFAPLSSTTTASASASAAPQRSIRDPRTQIIYSLLASAYLCFAFNHAVVLRLTDDVRIWKALVLGIVICDAGHLWASWAVFAHDGGGGWAGLRVEDWFTFGMLLGPGAVRVALLCGVGVKEEEEEVGGKGKGD